MDAEPEPSCKDVDLLDSKLCPFCFSEDLYKSGSWSLDKCLYCGAVYFMGEWLKDG